MTEILYIRHAAVDNPDGVFYGRLPGFGLSPAGREAAERTARFLSLEPLAVIYHSPQLRAQETARILGEYHPGVPVELALQLAELMTSWQGMPQREMPRGWQAYTHRREPGDESVEDIYRRMNSFLRWLLGRYPDQVVVCVSHSDPIAILLLGLAGKPLTHQSVRGAHAPGLSSITRLRFRAPDQAPEIHYVDPSRQFEKAEAVLL